MKINRKNLLATCFGVTIGAILISLGPVVNKDWLFFNIKFSAVLWIIWLCTDKE